MLAIVAPSIKPVIRVPVPVNVRLPESLTEVNAPDAGVVAPTVPLMLIDAVPVRLVTVPLLGVPKAPPLVTKEPAVPTFVPRAVTTPVPVVVVLGATPAPPPITKAFADKAADDAHVVLLEKYGTPPLVPATVNAGVVVGVATDTMPPVKLTLVTEPYVSAGMSAVVKALKVGAAAVPLDGPAKIAFTA